MANYVRISVLSPSWLTDRPASNEQAVQRMVKHLTGRIAQVLPDRPDLIVLPETCDQYLYRPGETLPEAYYYERGDQVLDALAMLAKQHRCYIAYPALRTMADSSYRNSIRLIDRSGTVVGTYDKYFLTSHEMDAGIIPGETTPVFDLDFGRVACAICFDLNFEELRQAYAAQKPDLVVFASAYHGGLMQAYWAYACRAHFVGAVARLPSPIISPVGVPLAMTTNYHDFATARVNLDCEVIHLDRNRQKFRSIKDAYGPEVTIYEPGLLGSALISSESDHRTVPHLVDEFNLIPLDTYFSLAREERRDCLTKYQRRVERAVITEDHGT